MDFVYIAGPALISLIFAGFAITQDPQRSPILRNLFFLATLASLLLVANMSVHASTSGDWVVNSTTFNATDNSTAYTYTQKAPSFNLADFGYIYMVLTTVIWVVFAWLMCAMLLNVVEWIMKSLDATKKRRDEGG